ALLDRRSARPEAMERGQRAQVGRIDGDAGLLVRLASGGLVDRLTRIDVSGEHGPVPVPVSGALPQLDQHLVAAAQDHVGGRDEQGSLIGVVVGRVAIRHPASVSPTGPPPRPTGAVTSQPNPASIRLTHHRGPRRRVRRETQAAARATKIAAPAVTWTPRSNAAAADSWIQPSTGALNRVAKSRVLPRVWNAFCCSPNFATAGIVRVSRKVAVSTVPSTAVPSTAAISYAVSEIAEAAPAFCGGTLDRIRSLVIVSARPIPMPSTVKATSTDSTVG